MQTVCEFWHIFIARNVSASNSELHRVQRFPRMRKLPRTISPWFGQRFPRQLLRLGWYPSKRNPAKASRTFRMSSSNKQSCKEQSVRNPLWGSRSFPLFCNSSHVLTRFIQDSQSRNACLLLRPRHSLSRVTFSVRRRYAYIYFSKYGTYKFRTILHTAYIVRNCTE